MEKANQPLVSVAVITYNSSKTVVETLDSIYNQTYPNLELIVSDDCSPDNTVEICREWIETHKERFARAELLTVEKNTGVAGNMNRAEKACRGEWVKVIAGDDLLMLDCVESYVHYSEEHQDQDVIYVFSRVILFGDNEEQKKKWEGIFLYDFFYWELKQQYDFLTIERNCIPAASAFFNRKKVELLGVEYDDRIPMLEDWPRWIVLVKKGVKFHFIDKELVKYRISETSLSTGKKTLAYLKSNALVYKYYCFDNDYHNGSKRNAVLKYLRAEKLLHDNRVFWKMMLQLYKLLIIH